MWNFFKIVWVDFVLALALLANMVTWIVIFLRRIMADPDPLRKLRSQEHDVPDV